MKIDIIINIVIPIGSVFIGGMITYLVSQSQMKRNILIETYLELLHIIQGRYYLTAKEYTEEYLNIIRKLYLIASPEVLDLLNKNQFIPPKDRVWSSEKKYENAFKEIVLAMRKDIGNSKKLLKKVSSLQINYDITYFKENEKIN